MVSVEHAPRITLSYHPHTGDQHMTTIVVLTALLIPLSILAVIFAALLRVRSIIRSAREVTRSAHRITSRHSSAVGRPADTDDLDAVARRYLSTLNR